MTRNEARAVEVAVATLARALAEDPRLHAEVLRARREFFGGDATPGPALRGAADTAEHRFAEWFGLERESETLGVVPCEVSPFAEVASDIAGSVAGVYLVLGGADGTVQARDLQDDSVLDLGVPAGSLVLGDMLVGRLFPQHGDEWTPSTAAAIFRPGQDLAEAFRRDVRRLGLDRRLQQVELEHLLLRRTDQGPSPTSGGPRHLPLEHLEAELDKLLKAGRSTVTATAVSARLELASRPGPVMGPLLEELAFASNVDLDVCRQLLLQIWNSYHSEQASTVEVASAPSSEPPGETLGERLVRTLDEGLRCKRDVEELFAQIERMAGLEPGTSDEDENPHDAEDADADAEDAEEDEEQAFGEERDGSTGDLDPLVQEYLWETGRDRDAAAAPLRLWVELQSNSALPHTDLEFVTGTDLMRLLLHVYLAALPTERAAAVQSAFAEVQRFYAWAASIQEIDLRDVLAECQGPLLEHVERLQAAGLALSTATPTKTRPGILQIDDLGPQGFGVSDDDGGHHWLIASGTALACLRVGDLVLGALAPATASGASTKGRSLVGLVVVLPVDARALME